MSLFMTTPLSGRDVLHAFALPPCLGEGQHEVERTAGSVRFALVEIALDAAELVGHVGEADDRLPPQSSKGIERGGLHLDGQKPVAAARRDRLGRLTERRIRGPCRAAQHALPSAGEGLRAHIEQIRIAVHERRGRQIMVARSLIAQRPSDEDVARRREARGDLASRRDADQKFAAGNEQLFGDEDRERSSNGRADDAEAAWSRTAIPTSPCDSRPNMATVARRTAAG